MADAQSAFFSGTIAPHDALALLSKGMDPEIAAPALAKRLAHALVRARARHMTISVNGFAHTEGSLIDVPASHWTGVDLRADAPFWKTGDVSLKIDCDEECALFGVRFVTQDIELWHPKPPRPRAAPNSSNKKPPPSEAAYERWRDTFLATHGDRYTAAEALRSAKAHFPANWVTREKVRELIPAQKPGRPASRQKTGE